MPTGIIINGLYVAQQDFENTNRDGQTHVSHAVLVSVGTNAYRVYLQSGEMDKLAGIAMGDPIMIAVTPIVGRNGVSFVRGKVCD